MLYAGIYLSGMVLGFFASALTKGKGRLWDDNNDTFIPVVLTFFWPLAVLFLFGFHVIYGIIEAPNLLSKLFFGFLSKTVKRIDNIRDRGFSRKKNVAPVVKQSYRQSGHNPCIACGTPTSIDQSHMECVESEEAQRIRLDI